MTITPPDNSQAKPDHPSATPWLGVVLLIAALATYRSRSAFRPSLPTEVNTHPFAEAKAVLAQRVPWLLAFAWPVPLTSVVRTPGFVCTTGTETAALCPFVAVTCMVVLVPGVSEVGACTMTRPLEE